MPGSDRSGRFRTASSARIRFPARPGWNPLRLLVRLCALPHRPRPEPAAQITPVGGYRS